MTSRILTGAAAILLLAELWAILFLRDDFFRDGAGSAASGLTLGAALVCIAALAVIAGRLLPGLSRHGWRETGREFGRTYGGWEWAAYAGYGAAVSASAWAAGPGGYPHAVSEALWFVALAAATAAIATNETLRRAMVALLLAGLAVLLTGVFGPTSGVDLDGRFLRYDSIVQWGAYPEIGMLAGLGAAAALALLFTVRGWWPRTAAVVLGAAFAAVPFLVKSRGAQLALLAVAVWLTLAAPVPRLRRLARVAAVIGCVVALAAGIMFRGPIASRMTHFGQGETSLGAASSRTEHWRVALRMTADHPLLGVGPGHYPLEYSRYSPASQQRHAHNMLLHVAAETGLLALIPFLVLWCRVLWLTLHAAGRDREGQTAFVLHALLAAFFVRAMLDQFLSNVHSSLRTSLLIAVLLGLAEAAVRSRRLMGLTPTPRPPAST